MARIKTIYAVQRKMGKSNRWENTHWNETDDLKDCKRSVVSARDAYPNEIYRIIRIKRIIEIVDETEK